MTKSIFQTWKIFFLDILVGIQLYFIYIFVIEQHQSLSEKFLRKGFWLYLFSFIIAPMGYIIKVIISGELSVSEVWVLYGVISLITLVSAYNDLGVTESLNHFIPRFVTQKEYGKVKSILLLSFWAQLVTGGTIAAFFFFGAEWMSQNYFKTDAAIHTLKVFALFFLGINIFQIISTFFIAIQNTFYNKLIDFVRMSFILLFVLWAVFFGETNLETFSYAWIVWLYAGIVFAVIVFFSKYYFKYLSKQKCDFSIELLRKIFWYAGLVFLGTQAWVILSQMDMQMIIYLLGTQDAGYYTNYLSIISIPFMIITPIFALLFPVFSELHSKKEYSKITLIKNMLGKNLIHIAIMVNILFFVFAEILAYILFWQKFITSWSILQYSVLFLVFNFLFQINFNILAWIWQVGKRVKIICIGIVVNFCMNLVLIHLLGVFGAALATAIWWIVIWRLSETMLGNTYRMTFDFYAIIKNLVVMLVVWCVTYIYILPLLTNLWRVPSLGYFCILTGVYALAYFIINKEEIHYLIQEIQSLRWRKKST